MREVQQLNPRREMARAGEATTHRGRASLQRKDIVVMTEQPSPVTSADMATALLDQVPARPPDASAAELTMWHEVRARLMTDIAGVVDTPEAHAAAADARRACLRLVRQSYERTEAAR
jgi:hypothetical protein